MEGSVGRFAEIIYASEKCQKKLKKTLWISFTTTILKLFEGDFDAGEKIAAINSFPCNFRRCI